MVVERAEEISNFPMCAEALRVDATGLLGAVLLKRAKRIPTQTNCSEAATHAAATDAYFASPYDIIAEYKGDLSSGLWPPKKLADPLVQACIDTLELSEKMFICLSTQPRRTTLLC